MILRKQVKILVVDDMATSRALITQALDSTGFSNYRAEADPETAFNSLLQDPVHLVLSDLNMPKMDGMQLLAKIRSHPKTKGLGFILVTGKPTPKILEDAKRFQLNNMIKKPFTPESMLACLEAVVGRSQGA